MPKKRNQVNQVEGDLNDLRIRVMDLESRLAKFPCALATEVEKVNGRISGAYAAIAACNKSVARLAAQRQVIEPTKNLTLRREVLATVMKDLEHHDETLNQIGMHTNGLTRKALRDAIAELKEYL